MILRAARARGSLNGYDEGLVADNPAISNWSPDSTTTKTITTGAGSPWWFNVVGNGARWVRVQWANTSGTGTLTSLRITGKGAG